MSNESTTTEETDFFQGASIDTVYPSKQAFQEKVASAGTLRIYLGIDPTNPVLHLGHTVPLRILKRFQDRGHTAIILIGDLTATVGDPSGRDAMRSVLTRETVEANVLALKEQIFKVLDPTKTEIRYNSEWYDDAASMGTLRKFLSLAHSFTTAQLSERDLFQRRQEKKEPVSVTEFLYPVLQAYDSVALDVDVEVGGTDQTFNMLAGRTLMKQLSGKEKFVITAPLIVGTDGRKMSKSYGNTIGVMDSANDMYGKIMSIPDELIEPYFIHITDRFVTDDHELRAMITSSPRDAKAALAREVVSLYHDTAAAQSAEDAFTAQFRDHTAPTDIAAVTLQAAPRDAADLLVMVGATASRSEAQRLIEQGGVSLGDTKIDNALSSVSFPPEGSLLKVGKRRFWNITLA